ncbi:hypothetical protein GCM10009720_09080 [Yaniella flava]|uniref:Uncharacterized protein n=2 Tax=Yaniella flava TaxID=287930 RepID=A0ABN2U7S7_9MICC
MWVQRATDPSGPPAEVFVKAHTGAHRAYGVTLHEGRMRLVDMEHSTHGIPATRLAHDGMGPRHYIPRDYFDSTALGDF